MRSRGLVMFEKAFGRTKARGVRDVRVREGGKESG